MRRFGQFITWLGVVLGGALGLSLLFPTHLTGLAWIVGVAVAKLTFFGAIGLIAGGAIIQRIAIRAGQRVQLPPAGPS